jgi:hypothetical protein
MNGKRVSARNYELADTSEYWLWAGQKFFKVHTWNVPIAGKLIP